MIAPPMRPLERWSVVTLLGIRFWDAATDRQVTDGLRVSARPDGSDRPVVTAFRTASGVYAFQGLPGLRHLEYPGPAPRADGRPPIRRRFVVEVDDAEGRFVPVAVTVELPLPYRGTLRAAAAGSPPGDARFYLFSSVARPVPGGLAVVRADLVDAATGEPAAHAVLETTTPEGAVWPTVADARGQAALLLPYPAMPARLEGSPAAGPGLAEQRWPLTIRVRYAPAHLRRPAGGEAPDLRSIVTQPHATVWESEGAGASGDRLVELVFGEPLVLRSEPGPALLVSAAA